MKGLLLVLVSIFATASTAAEEVATCVRSDRTEALTYLTDANFKVAVLNGTVIGQGRPLEKGADHYAIEVKGGNPYEALFAYPLKNGQLVIIAWTVDPRGVEVLDPSFRAKVLRMELIAQNGDRQATYGECETARR